MSFDFPKISAAQTATQLRERVLMQLALMAADNGKPSKNGAPKEEAK